MPSPTCARKIDAAYAAFSRSAAAQDATQRELDLLCCFRWPPGYVPRVQEYAHMLIAMRLGVQTSKRPASAPEGAEKGGRGVRLTKTASQSLGMRMKRTG